MIYLYKIWPRVVAACTSGSQKDSKRIAELSMALHYIAKFTPTDALPATGNDDLRVAIYKYIHKDTFLKMLNNYFLLQQHITPYVFIRGHGLSSTYYENLLRIFHDHDLAVQECFHYRSLERGHLLYKLGKAPLPAINGCPILKDARQLQFFNRDMSYALTHTLLYATDFSDHLHPDGLLKDCCMLLMAQSFDANDIDLFLETCVCFLSQHITDAERNDMLAMISGMRSQNILLFTASDVTSDYHPLLVHDILRALVLRRFKVDILSEAKQGREQGPISGLSLILKALKGKDPAEINTLSAAYMRTWGERPFLANILQHKLNLLSALAKEEVLFQRELSLLGQENPGIYPAFLQQLNAVRT